MPETAARPIREIGRLEDANGCGVTVAVDCDGVIIRRGGKDILLGPAQRNELMQLFNRAEWAAEAWAAEHADVVEAEVWCQIPGCLQGPGSHLYGAACATENEAAAGHAAVSDA